jgi:hypothetical protein
VITIFSTTKRFEDAFAVIQRNAIRSWCDLAGAEVILFGGDAGVADEAKALGVRHVADVKTTDSGLPLVGDMFRRAQDIAKNDILCYVNADVILTDDVLAAATSVRERFPRFLVVAQRHDLDVAEEIEPEPGWQARLRDRALAEAQLMSESAIDFFLFTKSQYRDLPALAIGRVGWDNFLLWHTVSRGIPLIDATGAVVLIHQRHDYSQAGGSRAAWYGADARRNRALVGHWSRFYTIAHAQWVLRADGRVVPATSMKYRLARPKRVLSEALRFTRPLRDYMRSRRLEHRTRP